MSLHVRDLIFVLLFVKLINVIVFNNHEDINPVKCVIISKDRFFVVLVVSKCFVQCHDTYMHFIVQCG